VYTTASGLPQLSIKHEGSVLPGLLPQCDLTAFSLKCIWRSLVCHNLLAMVGLSGRIWSYVGHWCWPVPSEDLERKEAVTVYKLLGCN